MTRFKWTLKFLRLSWRHYILALSSFRHPRVAITRLRMARDFFIAAWKVLIFGDEGAFMIEAGICMRHLSVETTGFNGEMQKMAIALKQLREAIGSAFAVPEKFLNPRRVIDHVDVILLSHPYRPIEPPSGADNSKRR